MNNYIKIYSPFLVVFPLFPITFDSINHQLIQFFKCQISIKGYLDFIITQTI
jgi:hypothetical protein